MHFGLQKLTLLDFPGQVACTVFSAGCNFRCPFCHNASLVAATDLLPFSSEDIINFLRKRTGVLDGVCFTGGEPLLNNEVPTLAAEAKALGYKVKLDTNGSFPEKLRELLAGSCVDYVAMDIKSSPANYPLLCGGVDMLEAVRRSVELLQSSDVPFEFRTTVTGNLHCADDFRAIGRWIGAVERYFLQPFADSGDILGGSSENYAVDDEKLQQFLAAAKEFTPNAAIRGR